MKTSRKRELVLLAICGFLSLAVVYLLMLDAWGLSVWGRVIDYPRFGTWSNALSGIGTTTALMIALLSLWSQRSIYQATEAQRLLEEETSLFLWLTSKEVRDHEDKLVSRLWDLIILNSTAAPIYHWKVTFDSKGDHLCNYLKRPLLPGENTFNLPFFDNLDQSKASESMLMFEGQSGRFWSRSTRGILVQIAAGDLRCMHAPETKAQAKIP